MNQTIQKAIEGGWQTKHNFNEWGGEITSDFANEAVLDPLFWQCLGKSLGWNDKTFEADGLTLISWQREWHKFIDHLASGGDPEEFFNNLLK